MVTPIKRNQTRLILLI